MRTLDLLKALLAVIAVGALSYVLDSIRPDYAPTPSAPYRPAPETAARNEPVTDRVVMRVNGEPVTESEFRLFLGQAPQGMRDFFDSPQGRPIAAGELVKLKVLEQEGRRLGIDREAPIAAQLSITRANVIAQNALRKIIPAPSDAQLRAEYEKEKKSLETIDLSHVLIAYQGGQVPPRSGKPLAEGESLRKAQSIAERARGGADFSALARAQSDDVTSAQQGGSLGAVAPGSMPPELDAAVAKLQPGEVSNPVKSEFGIHVFKAGPRRTQTFDAIREGLAARFERQRLDEVVSRLQKSAKVEMDPAFFPPQKKPQVQN